MGNAELPKLCQTAISERRKVSDRYRAFTDGSKVVSSMKGGYSSHGAKERGRHRGTQILVTNQDLLDNSEYGLT